MLLIRCPYCGDRDETEFNCGGEAHIARPPANSKLTDEQFADYLFLRHNPKGVFLERWIHSAGCRRWFNVARDTVTHDILEIYAMGSPPKTKAASAAYKANWRRKSAAEAAAESARAKGGRR